MIRVDLAQAVQLLHGALGVLGGEVASLVATTRARV